MGLIDKIRTQVDLIRVDKYTKRRRSETVFQGEDRDFYRDNYQNGVYLHHSQSSSTEQSEPPRRASMIRQASSLSNVVMKAGRKSPPHIKSSETYNNGTYGKDLR
ncbi:hypothetical protein INT43_004774 [Umbelopsis isabellina]|uniref:Uncharacterized protein n=1 Tax=Mortierella isabellina TaxID=91625 RepID=A0A8H7PE41_MORIS|nr:hypothetical protein INT43_004774 [Umbelopsis isabellina]